jgi:hypothetical protein
MKTCVHLWQYLAELFLKWAVSDKSCRENQNTHFIFNIFFFRKSYRLWENVEKYYRDGQATDGNVIRHTHFAYWITQVTNTRLGYVILIACHGNNGYANAPKCYVNTYTACLVKISVWLIYF